MGLGTGISSHSRANAGASNKFKKHLPQPHAEPSRGTADPPNPANFFYNNSSKRMKPCMQTDGNTKNELLVQVVARAVAKQASPRDSDLSGLG